MPELSTYSNNSISTFLSGKDTLKKQIKDIYIRGIQNNQPTGISEEQAASNVSSSEPFIEDFAEKLSTAIDSYVKAEFARLREALTQPGAFTATLPVVTRTAGTTADAQSEPIQVTAGTIKDYQP